jgi:(p)ppGpp synthase/HD superfamily hydrolase
MERLGKRFDHAVKFARKAHKSQVRKGTEIPYISHLLGVTSIVLEMGGNEDEAIAAMLHDVVEDCGGQPMLERVREKFGDDVARIVWANSDTDEKPKPPWRARKQAYLDSLPDKRRDELMISLADKLHNARSTLLEYRRIGDEIWPRFKEGRESQLWYYGELVRHFTARAEDLGPACAPKLDDFVRTIEELSASPWAS